MSRRTTGLPRCQIFESERRAHHPARGTQPFGEAPAALREHLIAELDGLQSRRCRKLGHHRSPSAKNTLTSVDAQLVDHGVWHLATHSDKVGTESPPNRPRLYCQKDWRRRYLRNPHRQCVGCFV